MAALASSLLQLAASGAQAQATRSRAGTEAATLKANARLADLQAEDARMRGDLAAADTLRQGRAFEGAQRAALASQGVDVNSGTPLEIQEDTAYLARLDAEQQRNNAWREAFGYRADADMMRMQARLGKRAAGNEARMTLLTGGLAAARELSQTGLFKRKPEAERRSSLSKPYPSRAVRPYDSPY